MQGVALVTGGEGEGVDKITIADFNSRLLAEYAKKLEAEFPNAQVLPIVTDVTDEKAVDQMVKDTVAKFGRLDYCANCAGISVPYPFSEYDTDAYNRVIGVNQHGVFYALRAEIAQMKKQDLVPHPNPNRGSRRGAIVSISSIAGTRALPNGAAYVSSKHAVIGLTKTAALENGHLGIRVNCISPGLVITPLTQEEDNLAPGFMQTALDRTPLGRGGAPEDIGDVIVFLCSDQAAFVSGSNWGVDGAMLS